MTRSIHTLMVWVLIMAGGSFPAAAAGTPVGSPDANQGCPVTLPGDDRPDPELDPFDPSASVMHSDGLWVSIPKDGVLDLSPDDEITFGPLAGWRSTTVMWLRDDGVEGFVEVTGQRLDVESEFAPQTPLSPQRQYVRVGQVQTGLAFASEGCWEVVGSVGDHSLTWTVEVRFVDEIATPQP